MQEKNDIRLPRVLDANMGEVRRLHPTRVEYELNMMPLHKAQLTLIPEEAVTVGEYVELYDVGGSLGVFRVTETDNSYSRGGTMTAYLHHALTTLSDGVIFGYREYGGTGVNLRTVLTQLLALQPRQMWTLGTCEFTTQYQYSFENENLLRAIISLAEPLTEEYQWTYDTSVFPWVLNLIKAQAGDMSEMRLSRNVENVQVAIDRSDLCTRMYPLGYGEGVNQLTIAPANGGVKYLDADTISTWGVVASTYTETSVTEAATLKAMAQSVLEKVKNPTVTVTAKGRDLYSLTGQPMDKFYIGRLCRVCLPDYGVTLNERVVTIQKRDVYDDNTNVTVTLANKNRDSVNEMIKLKRKAAIGELYSQGSTNQYAVHFSDNADGSNPAEMSFYVDPNAVWINAVMCRFKFEAFRSYSQGAASGGGSTQTSSSGGGGTSGGGNYEPGGGNYTGPATWGTGGSNAFTIQATAGGTSHVHELKTHDHNLNTALSQHTHNVSSHTHSVPIPAHTHPLQPGIYRGGTASGATITVDGSTVPLSAIVNNQFDAVPYLSKDGAGKITRGTWHTIRITPDALTRIVADLHVKTFIRSISGGNY
ncbi:MAG: phage tail spike protein [Candidatus Limiplasma sp.]|nr:phage tail spike protein [Candidatus Limiplasma sp.]